MENTSLCFSMAQRRISLLYVAATIWDVHANRDRVLCHGAHCPGNRAEVSISILSTVIIALTICGYIPCIAVVIVTSTWSCVIFKKYYTGEHYQLNHRMLSLPVIMPLALVASTVLEIIGIHLTTQILLNLLSLNVYFGNWILFVLALVLIPVRFLNRIFYPLVLVYTHCELRRSVVDLLKRFKGGNNRVTPKNAG